MYIGMRIPVLLPRAPPSAPKDSLLRRDGTPQNIPMIVILGVVLGISVILFLTCCLRAARSRDKNQKTTPASFLKRLRSGWQGPATGPGYEQASLDETDAALSFRGARGRGDSTAYEGGLSTAPNAGAGTGSGTENSGVDRNTSIRSIMTLPAYNQKPSNTEQVLGREGERDGIDIVVEQPTAEAIEAMREDEMEALYNIRLARRQEIAEREDRRRLRREARERNDMVALEEIRARARAASNNTVMEDLRSEHQRLKDQRQRAVSSVSYADVGVARHDGTRVRGNSTESERVGLLSDAASFAASSTRSGARSPLHSIEHRRERSTSSVLSVDSDFPLPTLARSRANSRPETPRLSTGNTQAGSSPEIIEADVGESEMPPHSPPGYEDITLDDLPSGATTPHNEPPPIYSGPTRARSGSSMQATHLTVGEADDNRGRSRSNSRGLGGVPQLPSLRLGRLPQIVIEPSSARPNDR